MVKVVFTRKEITMWSNQTGRPVVVEGITWADVGLREKEPHEKVHLKDYMNQHCSVCGSPAGVWTNNETTHFTHRDKCR
jgi:glycerol kinase